MPRPRKTAATYMPALQNMAAVTLSDQGAQIIDATLVANSLSAINAFGNSLKTSNVMLGPIWAVGDSHIVVPYLITRPSHQTVMVGLTAFSNNGALAIPAMGFILQRGAP